MLLGLSALNRSRDALPPLIDAALASIAYYDETGDHSHIEPDAPSYAYADADADADAEAEADADADADAQP